MTVGLLLAWMHATAATEMMRTRSVLPAQALMTHRTPGDIRTLRAQDEHKKLLNDIRAAALKGATAAADAVKPPAELARSAVAKQGPARAAPLGRTGSGLQSQGSGGLKTQGSGGAAAHMRPGLAGKGSGLSKETSGLLSKLLQPSDIAAPAPRASMVQPRQPAHAAEPAAKGRESQAPVPSLANRPWQWEEPAAEVPACGQLPALLSGRASDPLMLVPEPRSSGAAAPAPAQHPGAVGAKRGWEGTEAADRQGPEKRARIEEGAAALKAPTVADDAAPDMCAVSPVWIPPSAFGRSGVHIPCKIWV